MPIPFANWAEERPFFRALPLLKTSSCSWAREAMGSFCQLVEGVDCITLPRSLSCRSNLEICLCPVVRKSHTLVWNCTRQQETLPTYRFGSTSHIHCPVLGWYVQPATNYSSCSPQHVFWNIMERVGFATRIFWGLTSSYYITFWHLVNTNVFQVLGIKLVTRVHCC